MKAAPAPSRSRDGWRFKPSEQREQTVVPIVFETARPTTYSPTSDDCSAYSNRDIYLPKPAADSDSPRADLMLSLAGWRLPGLQRAAMASPRRQRLVVPPQYRLHHVSVTTSSDSAPARAMNLFEACYCASPANFNNEPRDDSSHPRCIRLRKLSLFAIDDYCCSVKASHSQASIEAGDNMLTVPALPRGTAGTKHSSTDCWLLIRNQTLAARRFKTQLRLDNWKIYVTTINTQTRSHRQSRLSSRVGVTAAHLENSAPQRWQPGVRTRRASRPIGI